MVIMVPKDWRSKAIFASILGILVGLFMSRAFLSIAMMVFVLLTIVHSRVNSQLKYFFRSPLLLGMSLLFFIPLVSGFWSSDTKAYMDVLRVKLPFLLLPVAFAGTWQLRERQWKIVMYVFIALVFGACCWSLQQYASNPDAIHESYLKAKTIPTLLDNDHVRFSWLVCIAAALSTMLLYRSPSRNERVITGIAVLFFVIFLHILSARTGLLMLYLFVICFIVYMIVQRSKRFLLILGAIALISIASWFIFPTLQNRLRYNRYDLSFVWDNSNRSGYSDANRALSMKAGWHTLKANPWGVGAGDIRKANDEWYLKNTPAIREEDKLYPSNEWLVYGNMAGWPGLVIFSLAILIPFFYKQTRRDFLQVVFHIMAISSFLVETSLEIQFGVFIYAFIGLWWWKWKDVLWKRPG